MSFRSNTNHDIIQPKRSTFKTHNKINSCQSRRFLWNARDSDPERSEQKALWRRLSPSTCQKSSSSLPHFWVQVMTLNYSVCTQTSYKRCLLTFLRRRCLSDLSETSFFVLWVDFDVCSRVSTLLVNYCVVIDSRLTYSSSFFARAQAFLSYLKTCN